MKKYRLFFVFPLFLALFSSCTGNLQLEKRHYRSGFYFDRAKKQAQSLDAQLQSHSDTTTKTEKQNSVIADSTKLGNQLDSVGKDKTTSNFHKSISKIKNKARHQFPALDNFPKKKSVDKADIDKEVEASNIKRAFLFALLAVSFFVLGILASLLFVSTSFLLAIGLAVAFIFSTSSFVTGNRISKSHEKGEKYEGKNKVIFAKVIGIIGFALVALGIILLAAVIIILFQL